MSCGRAKCARSYKINEENLTLLDASIHMLRMKNAMLSSFMPSYFEPTGHIDRLITASPFRSTALSQYRSYYTVQEQFVPNAFKALLFQDVITLSPVLKIGSPEKTRESPAVNFL